MASSSCNLGHIKLIISFSSPPGSPFSHPVLRKLKVEFALFMMVEVWSDQVSFESMVANTKIFG